MATGVMVVILSLVAVPLSGTTATAAPAIAPSPSAVTPGSTVAVTGSGFPRNQAGYLAMDGSAGPAYRANGKGTFSVAMRVPNGATIGTHTIAARTAPKSRGKFAGPGDVTLASSTLTVIAGAPAPGPTATPVATSAPPPPTAAPQPTPAATASPTTGPNPAPTPAAPGPTVPPATNPPSTGARLLFGLGSQIEGARTAAITRQSPIHLLSSWYNGPDDLGWITDSWHRSIYQGAYDAGYALHLITWTELPETTFTASTGTVCGRAYPLSDRWRDDMRHLAQAFGGPAGGPPLYVTLFTEFQTYPCIDNAWSPNAQVTRYYEALIAQYQQGVAIFHQYAPNARVSLGWGGWQTRFDDPTIDGGRSMIPHFGAAMRAGDFVSFQAMAGDSNVDDIRSMTATLGAYGPVMLAHHMPDGDRNAPTVVDATFSDDVQALLTPTSVAALVNDGLFAWSFLNDQPMEDSTVVFTFVKTAVTTFAK